jgi:uncharacterized protein
MSLSTKAAALDALLKNLGAVVVAYSGGVDSAFLAHSAHEALGTAGLMVTAVSPSLSRRDLAGAKELAAQRGWQHEVVVTREVEREEYARNSPDRCYWCKAELLEVLAPIAEARGARIAIGTNVDDGSDYRPGLAAARERGAVAPLAEVGLTKHEIRELSRRANLPTFDRAASPCLASRFAYGVRVTPKGLRRIEAAEEVLRNLGFVELRVRDHGDLARIEVPPAEIELAATLRERIVDELLALGFSYVTLDLKGFRSGSLNEVLSPPGFRRA